jgi:hypothetical protein
MGLFDGIENAPMGGNFVYFLPGKYRVKVIKCFTMRSRKRDDLFIVECEILASDCPDRKPGMQASWCVNFKHDAALGNIKQFIAACNSIDPADEVTVNAEVSEEVCDYTVSDDNPLAGIEVNLTAVNTKTKEKKDFTIHDWTPVAMAA